MTQERTIDMSVEVECTVEQAWAAVATGPGISSWYVPHTIEEVEGGAASASFGPGMDVAGRITGWDPPRWTRMEGTEEGPGLTFEWFVEAKTHTTSAVRLLNGGYGTGTEWDGQYDAMVSGWTMFLTNLQLYCKHFAGQAGIASLPMGNWAKSPEDSWAHGAKVLGFNPAPSVGDAVALTAPDAPGVVGIVHEVGPRRITFTTTAPAEGYGFAASEGQGEQTMFSVWLYLYGDEAQAHAEAHQTAWMSTLADLAP